MTEEEEIFERIIKDSQKKLVTLELLSNFFNHKDLVAASIRTKVIHNLFQNNKNLDINKLELFHIQYTSSLVDLFQKLKRSKEQQYQLVTDEININHDIIDKLIEEADDEGFQELTKEHAKSMSKKITQLYNLFVSESPDVFGWNDILLFSNSVKTEYYRTIDADMYEKLATSDSPVYKNSIASFERKLLGRLNIHGFRIKFLCGLVYDGKVIEVYEFRDTNDRFVFVASERAFLFVDDSEVRMLDLSRNNSSKKEMINQMMEKNNLLKEQLPSIKTSLPDKVKEVLAEYVAKISQVGFLNELQNVDEQTNILKTMLNININ